MKLTPIIITFLMLSPLMLSPGVLAAENATKIDEPSVYRAFEAIKKDPAASISHQDGWSIVSLTEKGDRVYWFLAPDEDDVTPALIKKTIHEKSKDTHEIVIISECVAPRKKCEVLMKQFKALSKDYK